MPPSPTLQQEISQPGPFASEEVEALMTLARTAFVVRRRFEALMLEHGVTSQQYNVLRILRGAGAPLPTMMITERMIEPEPAITRMVRRLERKGLIRRTPGSSDARQVLCELTDAGRRTLETLDLPVLEMTRHLVRRLEKDQLTSLIAILADIRAEAGEAASTKARTNPHSVLS